MSYSDEIIEKVKAKNPNEPEFIQAVTEVMNSLRLVVDKEQKRSFKREVFSWIACIVVTILLTEFILNFVIINANIPSGSMENTIMTNDKLIALRTSYWLTIRNVEISLSSNIRMMRQNGLLSV